MSTTLHTFMDIFQATFPVGSEEIKLNNISIPIIQRDYAQGRRDPDVVRIRKRCLNSLYNAIEGSPITLDFVYGDIDQNGVMTPLDGQQRLTTLFLLHWYAAKRENIPKDSYDFLNKFSYETRYSARYFCHELYNFQPTFAEKLSTEIIDQAWFPLEWAKDPTIQSMLVMLDDIQEKFAEVTELWEKLENRAISFYFLPIKDMGLTDELYIKMNSRGKPLTLFEHFKAELEREMRTIDNSMADRIVTKIDRDWTDLLWCYRDSGTGNADDCIIDDEFLRYFKFVCDILCYRQGKSPAGESNDEFDLLQRYFAADVPHAKENIETLEAFFDCWIGIDGYSNPTEFLKSVFAYSHEQEKVLVDGSRYEINIFGDCLHSYSDKTGRTRLFPLNRIILLYGIVVYLQNQQQISYSEFVRRIRILNNLIQNSVDAISDRADRNRIPAILQQTDALILTGQIDNTIDNSFSVHQLKEEAEKIKYLQENPVDREKLYRLEDHPMLKGQIAILGLENLDLVDQFESLFTCKWDNIDIAMMSIGNYGQMERNKRTYQFASKGMQIAWDELFHRSANSGFENTKNILVTLLKKQKEFKDEDLQAMASDYIKECETKQVYPWRYYYIKYPSYRPGSYGKLFNDDPTNYPYHFDVMQTKSKPSQNTYLPYLKEADSIHLDRDWMGRLLRYGDQYVECATTAYHLCNYADDTLIEEVMIPQNEDGVDVKDRVEVLKEYLKRKGLV